MVTPVIRPLTAQADIKHAGGKARQIRFLLQQGCLVPRAFVCPWDTFEAFQNGDVAVLDHLRTALTNTLDLSKAYAVRSSANVEDDIAHSFAGQFDTVLNVTGIEALLDAIQTVWTSAGASSLDSYLQRSAMKPADLKMAIILQEMVQPVISGVSFSKNPLTGMDETIVEAVNGSGAALVQEGVTPDRWVYKWGDWIRQPDRSDISLTVIERIVSETQQIARAFAAPIDLEWVYDGTAVNWVQLREITSLSDLNIYSNRISREVLPGLIKPLIWSINVPLVNSAWIDIFTELIGSNDIAPEDLSRAFYYRAYFNMTTLSQVFVALGMPTETLELMMGIEGGDEKPRFRPSAQTFRHLPRMLRFGLDKLRFGGKIERYLPEMQAGYRRFATVEGASLTDDVLLAHIDALYSFTQRAAYFNIVGPLLMAAHNNRLQRQLTNAGVDFMQLDLMRGLTEWEQYDPNSHLAHLHAQFAALPAAQQHIIQQQDYEGFRQLPAAGGVNAFQEEVAGFISTFGHFSDSGNDFSAVPWRENKDLVLQMIVDFVPREGIEQKIGWEALPLSGFARLRFNGSYQRARRFRLYREVISFWYTFGYGLFRNAFLELGQRLTVQGELNQADDIFFLYRDEIQSLCDGRPLAHISQDLVGERRAEIEAAADVLLPDIIFGDDPPPPQTDLVDAEVLKGVATSRGYYKGPVSIITSVQEFDKVRPGDIIVIPYSDVSWTPLFGKAGAVIAESGGMLSHSSIVAREYNLPAVVSVRSACRLLTDGTLVAVDGFTGEITVLDQARSAE